MCLLKAHSMYDLPYSVDCNFLDISLLIFCRVSAQTKKKHRFDKRNQPWYPYTLIKLNRDSSLMDVLSN